MLNDPTTKLHAIKI